ncbi:DNA repair protein RecO [Nitrosovibrio sp. Nv17]|jgi:DNA repair protein RecO (recombination protein O)|uniref:DNA repair protein RecO n=1 Tax=Nitrosovibrio sp. Nv17 TaxID=1855339 RepID=UPI00090908A0|nr:DNA repair protein RecO [Nitrosovibrio sp. Nv17]SFW13315.1 DNA replication and repair protein RecO [Nitrosovibrio sp. Nv17]
MNDPRLSGHAARTGQEAREAATRVQAQEAEPAYVLHAYPYRETSLVVEAFTRDCGRIPLLAKGARRPGSALRGLLRGFQPLLLTWGGKSELHTLYKAEWQGGQPPLQGSGLICGFYLNELLVRLLHRHDPHEQLFMYYGEALAELGAGSDPAPILRSFEQRMLRELGYALTLDRDIASGGPTRPDAEYRYEIERGPVAWDDLPLAGPKVSGKTLLDMERGNYTDTATRQQSRVLMRYILNHYLGDRPLHTRQLLVDLHQLC